MARNISQIVDFIQYIVRKERGVFITPAQATANLDAAQLDCFEDWFDLYGRTQDIHDALIPFRIPYQTTSDANGIVTFPADYVHILGSPYITSSYEPIRFYNEDEWPNAVNSQLRPATTTKPIAIDTSDGFDMYPNATYTVRFVYLRRPVTPVYATIVGGSNGRTLLYDAANSVQLEWNDAFVNKIIAVSLKYTGINMDEDKIVAFGEQYQKEAS